MEAEPVSAPFDLPSPDAIRETAAEVIGRPDYNLGAVHEGFTSIIQRIVNVIGRLLRPFQKAFEALHVASPFLAWLLLVALVVILVGLIVHVAYTFRVALQGRKRSLGGIEPEDRDDMRPVVWEARAVEAARSGDYVGAVRFLFRACLLRLEIARGGVFRRGATNREYLRRFGDTAAREPLRLFVETIDAKWYGGGTSTRDDYERCAGAHSAIGRVARDLTDAQHA
jgi:hypothetical protein